MRIAILVALTAAVVSAAGCGRTNALPPTQSVLLTLDGVPAAGLTVGLLDESGKTVASGSTGADGKAAVRGGDDKPTPAGVYRVVVTDAGDEETNPMEPAKRKGATRVPPAASYFRSTPLRLTVEAGKMEYAVEVKGR